MSEIERTVEESAAERRRDIGTSIVEVMMTALLSSLLIAVLSTALIVTMRQHENTVGRLNVARGEQNLGMWLPADLASGQDVSTDPSASPCGTQCPPGTVVRGSNALMLTWTTLGAGATSAVEIQTRVSYRYVHVSGDYFLERIECRRFDGGPPSCEQSVIVSDMDAPPFGTNFVAGVTSPTWAFEVTSPLDPADDGSGVTTGEVLPDKEAQRVLVTINGGGLAIGAAGGRNQIVLGAGSTDRLEIDGSSVLGTPTFVQARSRCGGNIVIVVDESGSIGTSITQVRDAVRNFVQTFSGTPVRLKVVRFATQSSVLGTTGWGRWFNMLNDADVLELTNLTANLQSNGGTNWEDALFRTFYNSDGTIQSVIPDLVVFFTDGVPTYSRVNFTSATAPTTPPARLPGYPAATGAVYNQEAWHRANVISQTFRGTVRMIGVGVGSGITGTSTWLDGSPSTFVYERGNNVVWEKNDNYQWQRNNNFQWQRGNNVVWQRGNNLAYERGFRWVNSSRSYTPPYTNWETTSSSTYNSNNTAAGESDGWRTRLMSPSTSWTSVSMATYELSNTTPDSTDGWRTLQTSASTSWSNVANDVYERYNVTPDATDGWRISYPSASTSWTNVTDTLYTRYNTTIDSTDGWRISYPSASSNWSTVFSSQYDVWNTTTDSTDGWRVRQTSSSTSWTEVTKYEYDKYNSTSDASDGWRVTETSFLIPSTVGNDVILTRLIAGNDNGVRAISSNGVYTNTDQADMYVLPNWSQLNDALRAVALAECGGTLTVQTRVGSNAAADPFTYQNTAITSPTGGSLPSNLGVVTTTAVYPSGTFDFEIPSGQFVNVDILPTNTSALLAYNPGTWTCRAGGVARTFTPVSIPGSGWQGIRVRVAANEAVSCTHSVTRT